MPSSHLERGKGEDNAFCTLHENSNDPYKLFCAVCPATLTTKDRSPTVVSAVSHCKMAIETES